MKTILVIAAGLGVGGGVASAQLPPDWWRDAVFYEVFVRSFADSTEGPLAGDGVGDLRGLIERLDYLNDGDPKTDSDLGITGIWLMPIAQSPSYHGYDVVDYRRVDDEYGTNEDFRALIAACEARGIGVIVDLVLNHTSWQHPWFIESTDPGSGKRGWYVWQNADPGWKGDWGQKAWHATPVVTNGAARQPERGAAGEAATGPVYFGLFHHGMPDLNFTNAAVSDEAWDISRFWLEDMGAAGFRLDAVRHLIEEGEKQSSTPATLAWLEGYHAFVKEVKASAFVVGEVWADTADVQRYMPRALDSAFEFALAEAIVSTVTKGTGAGALRERIEAVAAAYPARTISTFLTNHDQDRVMSRLGGATPENVERAKSAATLLLTLPGVPFLYYGEEVGMTGAKPDEDIRTPMPWTPEAEKAGFTTGTPWRAVVPAARDLNVTSLQARPGTLWHHYRDLIALRQARPSLSRGAVRTIDVGDDRVVAFERVHEGERTLVLVNLASERIGSVVVPVAGLAPGQTAQADRLLREGRFRGSRADAAGMAAIRVGAVPAWGVEVLSVSGG